MNAAALPIALDASRISLFCRERGIRKLSLFGSVLRDDFASVSDLDILVEYCAGRHPGLGLFTQQDELAEMFGRDVDLHTPASLGRYFRGQAIAESLPIFTALHQV